jgi:HSP20 family protein
MFEDSRNGRVSQGLVIVLIVVVVIQSLLLYRIHRRLDRLDRLPPHHSDNAGTLEAASAPQPAAQPPVSVGPGPTARVPLRAPSGQQAPGQPGRQEEWDPFGEMERLQEELNSILTQAFDQLETAPFDQLSGAQASSPKLDLADEPDRFIVRLDIPGAQQDAIDVSVKDQVLTIKGRRAEETNRNDPNGRMLFFERRQGEFERSVRLPEPVDVQRMQTTYESGILTVILPKAPTVDTLPSDQI